MTTLIVNADDFGLTPGVNRAVQELQAAGALTSATLMANGGAFADAVRVAISNPRVGVGCHVVLVDGAAIAPSQQVPTLLDGGTRLHESLFRFLLLLQRGHISEAEIEREATSQIQRLQAAGLAVTHVDTHKHTHLFPRVARPLMRAAQACGVRAIRNPFEPAWSARHTRGALVRKLEVALLRNFQHTFHKLCREFGMATTDGCIGVSATGQLNADTLRSLLTAVPPGCYELVCHPGYNDAALDQVRTRLRQTREVEREVLVQLIPEAAQTGRVQLVSFGDLQTS